MKVKHTFKALPPSRIATFDVFATGLKKHHVIALLEFDVTDSRDKIRNLKRNGAAVSFNSFLIKSISNTVERHPEAAAFRYGKNRLIYFNDVDISLIVEKDIGGNKVPIPMIINHTNTKSLTEITKEIEEAKSRPLNEKDIVISRKSRSYERLYYNLPGFIRRTFWLFLARNPKQAFKKMGNVAITSVGMVGRINGWFVHKSVHPLSFGIGSIIKKAVVVNDEIKIREILNMTILFDHDVLDGAPMVRFVKDLTNLIESGDEL
jgi:pyruvate/2-oxoglutarate dehydrogenase complex dihydrolipoamide acyltransferase (E2) component